MNADLAGTRTNSRRNFVIAISAAREPLLGGGALLGAVPMSSQTVTSSVYGGDPNGSTCCGDLLLNVKDYGAAGDGTDATQAFLTATAIWLRERTGGIHLSRPGIT